MTDRIRTYRNAILGRMISGRDAFVAGWSARVPVQVTVILLSVVVGIGAGALAELLKYMMAWLWDHIVGNDPPHSMFHWSLLFLPLVGIVAAMVYQRYVLKQDLAHGTAQIVKQLDDHGGRYRFPFWTSVNSLIGCALTVGLGSSAGAEGPSALSGAALGSSTGRWFKLDPPQIRALVAIGAGAGIAAIFKAPVGGVLYVLEVLELPMTTLAVLSLVLSCTLASTTAYFISGTPFDMALNADFPNNAILGWVAVLGVVLGLYSLWYIWIKNRIGDMLDRIRNPWLKAVVAGVGMSACVFMVPALFGEGFGVMANLTSSQFPAVFDQGVFATAADSGLMFYITLAFILLIKGALVAAANNGGGVAGEMVPALFTGAIGGCLFGYALNGIFGMELPVWFMALTGMGAMLGCSSHAPLMSVFILCEMTNTLNFMPAYILCSLISYVVMKLFKPHSTWFATGHDDFISLWHRFFHRKDATPQPSQPRK